MLLRALRGAEASRRGLILEVSKGGGDDANQGSGYRDRRSVMRMTNNNDDGGNGGQRRCVGWMERLTGRKESPVYGCLEDVRGCFGGGAYLSDCVRLPRGRKVEGKKERIKIKIHTFGIRRQTCLFT